MPTNNPNGRPKSAPDGLPRTIKVDVGLSPLEADILDTRRGEESRAEHLRRKALAGDGEKEPT